MNARVDFIDLHNDDDSSPHLYEQINSQHNMRQTTTVNMAQSWIMKYLKIILIVSLIVILLVFGLIWLFKQGSSYKKNFNSTTSNLWHSEQIYSVKNQLKTDDQSCGGWIMYKDEKCFKIINDTLQTFDEAVQSCAKLERGASLTIIHSKEEQTFLTNQLFVITKKVEGFWVGAKYASKGNKFLWNDDTDFSYTNWNIAKDLKNRPNYCVQMQEEEEAIGKWISVPCEKKNAVVCQKTQTWSMARMQKTFLIARKHLGEALGALGEANRKIGDLELNLEEANQKINKNLIPIGFIYAQVPNTNSPEEIWPWMNWTDVSSAYAGVFFRALGEGSAPFGQVQQENFPQITHFTAFWDGPPVKMRNSSSLRGSLVKINTKQRYSSFYLNGIAFNVTTGEVRPRNMAIRIWKRTS